MSWYCRFTWHQHTRAEDVRRRVLEQHEAGTNLEHKTFSQLSYVDLLGTAAGGAGSGPV
ncbi:hypothetical protein MOQ72_43400 [Saccharopolyspora sp. K220]|uniref:hypothetical protein n=1 Tax=Saccharopolyspora soli TaxID=2926618 RepID=UPI001F5921CB|nr:hypothetical protein [Saccharopolyspora soli]MCI2424261.1 hypothetical protein [Saccharopolyspora soli]